MELSYLVYESKKGGSIYFRVVNNQIRFRVNCKSITSLCKDFKSAIKKMIRIEKFYKSSYSSSLRLVRRKRRLYRSFVESKAARHL